MPQYEPTAVYQSREGKRFPAAVIGYDLQGKLPQGYEGPRCSAQEAGEPGLPAIGYGFDSEEPGAAIRSKIVQVQEFKSIPLSNGSARPVVDVKVNFGTNKRGEDWKLVMNVPFRKDIASGGNVMPKAYIERIPIKRAEAAKVK